MPGRLTFWRRRAASSALRGRLRTRRIPRERFERSVRRVLGLRARLAPD